MSNTGAYLRDVGRVTWEPREMAQWLKALLTLAEDPSLVLNTHNNQLTTTWNQFREICCPLLVSAWTWKTHIHT